MNTRDGRKSLPSVSGEKIKAQVMKSDDDSVHSAASVVSSKISMKTRHLRQQRKGGQMRAALEDTIPAQEMGESCEGKRLYVVRHGERVDFTFGPHWIDHSFDYEGSYVQFDMNMPKSLPQRKGTPQSFMEDSPLTVQGLFQARLVGESMRENRITFSHIYSSPALRCIQTADAILSGLSLKKAIFIEPGIFEWMMWHQNGLPSFMMPGELKAAGFDIDASHHPFWTAFDVNETLSDYYDRCHMVTSSILEKHKNEAGNVLLVSHKGSVDVCVRQLVGHSKLTLIAFRERVSKVPYCAVSCCLEGPDCRWKLVSPGLPCFTHSANKRYDWRLWL